MSKKYIPPKCYLCESILMPGKLRYEKDGKHFCMSCYEGSEHNPENIETIEDRFEILDL